MPVTIEIDDVTWNALRRLGERLNIDPQSLARDILRLFAQLLRYYIVQADTATICKDVLDVRALEAPHVKSEESLLNLDKNIVREQIISAAVVLAALKKANNGRYPEEFTIDQVKEALKSLGVSQEYAGKGLRMLQKFGFVKEEQGRYRITRPQETLSRFINCAAGLARLYGLNKKWLRLLQ